MTAMFDDYMGDMLRQSTEMLKRTELKTNASIADNLWVSPLQNAFVGKVGNGFFCGRTKLVQPMGRVIGKQPTAVGWVW